MLQFAAAFLFDVAQLHTQGHELFEVAVFACERLFVSGQRVLQCDSSCQADSLASHWANDWSRVTRAVS